MAQLTGLRQLLAGDCWELCPEDLLQLVSLRQLTSLGFECLGANNRTSDRMEAALHAGMSGHQPGYRYAIFNKASHGEPPDVSSQLLQVCNEAIGRHHTAQKPAPQPGWLSRLVGVLMRPLQQGAP